MSAPKQKPAPEPEHIYLQRLGAQAMALGEKIKEVASQSSDAEIWCTLGDLSYGHPVTPLLLEYRGLMWRIMHPPDPRGEPMYSRPGPYKLYIETKDIMQVFNKGERTAQRLMQMARKSLQKGPRAFVTVEEFCWLHNEPEERVQKRLHELFLEKWNKYKRDHPDEDLE